MLSEVPTLQRSGGQTSPGGEVTGMPLVLTKDPTNMPPLIGALAAALTLSGALGLVAVAAAAVVLLAPTALSRRSPD
jgi:hypothetical protein